MTELERMKARFEELKKQRADLEAKIAKAQEPLLKDRWHPDRRTKLVPALNKMKEAIGPMATEMTLLAKALSGKL